MTVTVKSLHVHYILFLASLLFSQNFLKFFQIIFIDNLKSTYFLKGIVIANFWQLEEI